MLEISNRSKIHEASTMAIRKQVAQVAVISLVYSSTWAVTGCGFSSQLSPFEDLTKREYAPDPELLKSFVLDQNSIPEDPANPISEAKVELGKALFFDTATAITPQDERMRHTYSCAACHTPAAGFSVKSRQAIAEGGRGFGEGGEERKPVDDALFWDVQPVRSLSILNVAYQRNTLGSGVFGAAGANAPILRTARDTGQVILAPFAFNFLGLEGVETQAIAAQFTHGLMHASPDADITSRNVEILARSPIRNFAHIEKYQDLYEAAFPEFAGQPELISAKTTGLAIAAYERTVIANEAPFQRYLRGDLGALSPKEIRGMNTFFNPNKGNCVSCHSGPAFGADRFYAIGFKDFDPRKGLILPGQKDENGQVSFVTATTMDSLPESAIQSALRSAALGRGLVPGQDQQARKFRVPQLYNLADAGFYGHGGSFRSLEKLVRYKIKRQSENPDIDESHLAPEFQSPMEPLSNDEIAALVEFLKTSLRDPNLIRYAQRSTQIDGITSTLVVPSGRPAITADGL